VTSPLEQLALILARNYFDTSQTLFATDSSDGPQVVFATGSRDELARRQPQRTVLVLGPDAAIGAFGKPDPRPEKIIQLLRRHLAAGRSAGGAARNTDGTEEEPDDPGDPARHDRALAALIRAHGEAEVSEALFDVYGSRHRPHLAFEVIAHMFRHRFLDAIINFSPDELLDEAIEGEMGTAEYRDIRFEGQCTGVDPLVVDRRLKIPLYVKPHGSISYPNSIRLVPAPESTLRSPMHRLIATIIGGHWADARTSTAEYRPYHVNLITMGAVMNIESFRSILEGLGKGAVTLFHLAQHGEQPAGTPADAEWKSLGISVVQETRDLTKGFRTLWDTTSRHFQEGFGPRGIARHEIIHNLFFAWDGEGLPGKRVPRTGDQDYFHARLLAEVAIAIARGNGQIDLGTMSESRIGRTFELLRKRVPMIEILRRFNKRVSFEGPDNSAFRFAYPNAGNARELNQSMAQALWGALLAALEQRADGLFKNHLGDIRRKRERTGKMIERFKKLASSDAHDINPSFRDRHLLLSQLQGPEDVIHTSLGMTLRFVEMMNDTSWDLMLAITETGKVMEHYDRHEKKNTIVDAPQRRFCLILAGNDHPEIAAARLEPFRKRLLGLGGAPFLYVPESAHNQHMVLLLKRDKEGYRPLSAVRYETPRLGNSVNPVFIREEAADDLDATMECFKRYLELSIQAYQPGTTGPPRENDPLREMEPDKLWAELLSGLAVSTAAPPKSARGTSTPETDSSDHGRLG